MNTTFDSLTEHWYNIAPLVAAPHTDRDYQKHLDLLNQLIDIVGENEQHPLASLLNFVGMLVSDYEKNHFTPPEASPQQVLAFLMQEHQLKQSDLPEIGSQGVVSEILNGKRQLNARQIKALAERFAVSPSVFI
jgi:HTH-type transcriptional regulator/antitoxin HigA